MAISNKLLLTAMVGGMLALAGCGGDKASDAKQGAATAGERDSITLANGAEPESLDLHKASDAGSFNVIRQMFLGLTATGKNGEAIPSLAESWENKDEKVWTFKLRDAKWSNGDAITAHDFVYSLRRLVDPNTGSPYGTYLVDAKVLGAKEISEGKAGIETLGVKAIDDKTLEITLTEAVHFLPDLLTLPVAYAVPQKAIEQHGAKWLSPENIVVSGAYKLKDWQVNGFIKLERNEAYYDNANTNIKNVTFLPITDASVSLNRYKAGELDVGNFPPNQFQKVKAELGEEMSTPSKLCTFSLEFNTKKAPFDDAKVRKAVSMAIDRETIANKVLGRGENPAYQYTPAAIQGMGEFKPDWQALDKSARAAEAKKLLSEAGYGDAKPLNFEILYSTNETGKMLTTASASMIKEQLGVQPATINQEWKTFLDTRRQGNFQVAFVGWCSDYNEPSSFLNTLRSDNSNNSGKYSNPEFDKLLDAALQPGLTAEERTKIYHQAEAILDKDAPMAYVYTPVSAMLVKPYLQADSLQDPSGNWLIKDWAFK